MRGSERYSALAGRVGYFSLRDGIHLVTDQRDAQLVVTVTPDDIELNLHLTGSGVRSMPQSERVGVMQCATVAERWLWGLQVEHLDPHNYGLELVSIPWIIPHDGRPLDADSLPRGQNPGWLGREEAPVAWIAPNADPRNPLTPILQPRINRDYPDVEWVVVQAAVDAGDADSDGVLAFAWDSESGMQQATEFMLNSDIDSVNALRALSQPAQWNSYRERDSLRHEVTRIYNSISARTQRTPESLGAQVAYRVNRLAPRGVRLVPPVVADTPQAVTSRGRHIAMEWDLGVQASDNDTMQDLAAACAAVDSTLTLVRVSTHSTWERERVYLTRTPRLFAELHRVVDPHLLNFGGFDRAARIAPATDGVDVWANGVWERILQPDPH